MIQPAGTGPAHNLIVLKASGQKSLQLRVGSIVRATVAGTRKDGSLTLKLADPGGGKPLTLKAFTEIPLSKGQAILLEVTSASDVLNMRLLGGADRAGPRIPQQLAGLLNAGRAGSEEPGKLLLMLSSLPESIKSRLPGLGSLLRLMNPGALDGQVLRAFVESSGVGLEARLRIAALGQMPGLSSLQENADLKAVLLNLQKLLGRKETISTLRRAGLNIREIAELTGRFIRNIELYQLTSRINDMFCTFLPPAWHEMKEGDIIFRKKKGNRHGAWNCDINLDLKDSGRIRISITMKGKSFFVTFHVESEMLASLIKRQKDFLAKRFSSGGMNLEAVNISKGRKVEFGKPAADSISLKI